VLLAHPRIKVKHIIYLSSVCGLKSGPPQQKIIATPLAFPLLTYFEDSFSLPLPLDGNKEK
jgi:hypothetical protein